TRYAQAFGDVLLGQSLGAQEDNFRAPTIADRDRARASPAAQLLSLVRLQLDAAPSHDCLPQWPANYYHCPVGFAILFPKHHTSHRTSRARSRRGSPIARQSDSPVCGNTQEMRQRCGDPKDVLPRRLRQRLWVSRMRDVAEE